MDKDLAQRVQELEDKVMKLEKMKNIDFIKLMREEIFGQPSGEDDTAVTNTITITIGAGGGSDDEDVLDFPDGFLEAKRPNGEVVLIPTYNKTRF